MKGRGAGRPKHTNRLYMSNKEKALMKLLIQIGLERPDKVFGDELPTVLTDLGVEDFEDMFKVGNSLYQKVR